MPDTIIKVENLSKKYIIGHQRQERYTALRDVIAHGFSSFPRRLAAQLSSSCRSFWPSSCPAAQLSSSCATTEEFFALKDVSFEIKQGDRVGIIGRNGAGKSTLLKILSRITEPTSGRVEITGRVASLLEVGTGFHPELTGRENIYLNGAILGMGRNEIKRKFDEIVDFAEVEKFLDTPVKHFSSGMYVRLAFSVAAHLEPEILIVDEVLAVGDAAFQKKCLGKMEDVAHEGRTVLFVSHNMHAIRRLCERCVLISQGLVVFDGEVSRAIDCYLKSANANQQISWPEVGHAPGNDIVRLRAVRFVGLDGTVHSHFDVRDSIVLEIEFQVYKKAQISTLVQFHGGLGTCIMESMDNYINGPWGKQSPYLVGAYRHFCHIPGDLLNEGQLSINLWFYSPPFAPHQSPHIKLLNFVSVDITDSHDINGARGSFPYEWSIEPAVRPKLRWTTEQIIKNND